MDREIRFRAWIPKRGRRAAYMSQPFSIYRRTTLFDGDIVMQSTGLKDKNGKEIWESDIVEYKLGFGLVMWQEFRACWAVGKPDRYNNDLFNYVRNGGKCKVVGNLWETPELLNESVKRTEGEVADGN